MKNLFTKKYVFELLILFFIVILASVFRFTGINWDDNSHLHPDERYITMVAVAINWPKDFKEYINPEISPLSPVNNGYGNYIYGTFPLFLVKYIADSLELSDYNNITIVGRTISGVIDIGSLLLIYFIGNNVYKRKLGLLSALFYAVAVMPIQQSHFFTTDNYETFFILVVFSLLLIFLKTRSTLISSFLSILIGASMGFALASKISAIIFGAIIAIALVMKFLTQYNQKRISKLRNILFCLDYSLIIGITIYIVLRLAQPYIFASGNWLDLNPNEEFINALNFQRQAMAGKVIFPPSWQWVGKTAYIFPLKNLLIWGLGPFLGIATSIGLFLYIYSWIRYLKHHYHLKQLLSPLTSPLLLMFLWIVFNFLYYGNSFVKTFRYFLPVIPFMIILASFGIYQFKKYSNKIFSIISIIIFIPTLFWAIAFLSIYMKPTTRVVASNWIYENIGTDKTIAVEHWDDPIPLSTIKYPSIRYPNAVELEVYGYDNIDKIPLLYSKLEHTDYIFISSDRARKTIGELPESYPVMTKYYEKLDSGNIGFQKVAEFNSYPQIFGISIKDNFAEEAFWVYDHPRVLIYKKVKQLSLEKFSKELS